MIIINVIAKMFKSNKTKIESTYPLFFKNYYFCQNF